MTTAPTTTEVQAGHTEAAEHEPTLLGLGAEGWVYTGITIFFLLAFFVGKIHRKVTDALDAQIAETRRTLDEAKALRAEAEAALSEAKAQRDASAKDAKAMLANAEHESEAILAKAEADSKAMVERRKRMAEDKIAAAEREAVEDVRNRAVNAATVASRRLIAAQHDAKADKALADKVIAEI
jgi:F-type H+-transporting ATPase subunit b